MTNSRCNPACTHPACVPGRARLPYNREFTNFDCECAAILAKTGSLPHDPQQAFHTTCKHVAVESLNTLSAAIERARATLADDSIVSQTDLRDSAEKAINTLAAVESTRRFMTHPVRGEPLQHGDYDSGQELQIGGPF